MAEQVIDTLQLNIVVDNKGTVARINNTTKALKNLYNVIGQINGAGGVNGAVNGGASSKGGGSAKGTTNLAKNLSKSLNFGSMIAKLYFIRNVTKQLGQNLAKVVQYGIDYEETLNLWQTAMRGNISQARQFTSEMTKAYGISSATLMNYQATFKNMLSALGNISETTAYGLSEALTQMALDFSSLYNVSVEEAMTKFQAVLSGQVRPIRTAGYDITEQTLFQLYQNLGGTKTVRQLNQTEKQLLRILAVYEQMQRSGATGDLAKTITSSANQIRMMSEQGKEFATWIGVAFNTMLEKSEILIVINGYLYALTALAKQFAVSMGYAEKDYTVDMDFEDIEGANKAVDELKGKLLGFDKFQVLSSVSTKDVNIEQALLDALSKYDSIINTKNNPAFQYGLGLLEDWGYQLDDNGNIVGGFDKIEKKATAISEALALETFVSSIEKTFSLVGKLLPIVEEITNFAFDIFDSIFPLIEDIIENLVPALEPLKKIIADISHLVINILVVVSPIISMIADALSIVTPILEVVHGITYVVSTVLLEAIRTVLFILSPVVAIFETILKVVESIGEVIRALFQWDWASLGNNLSKIWTDWKLPQFINTYQNMQTSPSWKANGGLATKGSLFYAGEAGPELVTQTSGGGSTIMNMAQLEDAVAKGFIRGFAATDNGYDSESPTEVYVDGQRLFNIMRGVAKRNGYDLVNV